MEKKMHYPVMTERQVAARWKVSLKTAPALAFRAKKNPNRKTVGILCLVEVAGIEPASAF